MSHQPYLIITGAKILVKNEMLADVAILIHDRIIHAIIPRDDVSKYPSAEIRDFPANYCVVPGFIDMHMHGAAGNDVMDASIEALTSISNELLREGTTSYLATTMTASSQDVEKVVCNIRDYMNQSELTGANILGIHLEGPFLSPSKVGAQRSDLILAPDTNLIDQWQALSGNNIKLVTLAPELKNSLAFIQHLKSKNIVASLGHTDATYTETMHAIDAGCSYATHLFNAMRGIHQREPGAVTAALLSDAVIAELIVDGVHLHPAIVELALKLKGPDKLVLVTDAMRAKCLCDGEYDLGGQAVTVKQGVASLKDGTLAGSTLTMLSAIKNMREFTVLDFIHIIKMASENPAKILGVFDKKGSIAPQKDADLVVLDDNLNIVMTLCRGKMYAMS